MEGFFDIFGFGKTDEEKFSDLVEAYPQILYQAVRDFATLKAGAKRGIYSQDQLLKARDFFIEFPKLWYCVRPNFHLNTAQRDVAGRERQVYDDSESFVKALEMHYGFESIIHIPESQPQNATPGTLILIIAGIVALTAVGIAGIIWAVGYVKRQNNISEMIQQTAAGKIPPEVLIEEVKREESSVFQQVGSAATWLIVGIGAVLIFPYLQPIIKKVFKNAG